MTPLRMRHLASSELDVLREEEPHIFDESREMRLGSIFTPADDLKEQMASIVDESVIENGDEEDGVLEEDDEEGYDDDDATEKDIRAGTEERRSYDLDDSLD